MSAIERKPNYILLLLLLFFFHVYVNYEILNKSQACRRFDEGNYLFKGIVYYSSIFLEPINLSNIKESILQLHYNQHPPFVFVIEAIMIKLLKLFHAPACESSLILTANSFFLSILLLSVYGIGSTLYDKKVGLLAAFFVSFLPMVYSHARVMLLDFPLASMTALSFLLLFKTRKMQSSKYSIISGIALGLSQLTKESFACFVFLPLLYYFYQSYKTQKNNRIILSNIHLTLLFAVITAGVIYLNPANFPVFKEWIKKPFSLVFKKESLYYFKHILSYTGTYFAIAIVPALFSYAKNLKFQNKTILLWCITPFIIASLVPNKAPRFLILVLPAFALIVAQEIMKSKLFPRTKEIYASVLILVASLQYAAYFHGHRYFDPIFYRHNSRDEVRGDLTYRKDPYYQDVLEIKEFFRKESIKLDKVNQPNVYRVVFLFLFHQINDPLRNKLLSIKPVFLAYTHQDSDGIYLPEPNTVNLHNSIAHADYVVDSNGHTNNPSLKWQKDVERIVREGFKKYSDNFRQVADIVLSDGTHIYIYKNLNLEYKIPLHAN